MAWVASRWSKDAKVHRCKKGWDLDLISSILKSVLYFMRSQWRDVRISVKWDLRLVSVQPCSNREKDCELEHKLKFLETRADTGFHFRDKTCSDQGMWAERVKYSRSAERVLIQRPERWFHFAPVPLRYSLESAQVQTHVCLQGGHLLRDGVCEIIRKASRQVI